MKHALLFLLIFAQGARAQTAKPADHTPIYVLKYYYPEEPAKIVSTRSYARSVNNDGSFCLTDYDSENLSKVISSACFDPYGVPTETGSEKEPVRIYKDSIRINFRGKDTTVLMNTDKLKDPTALWFWKHMPKLNETVAVGVYTKNFTTKTIDLLSVSYTYLGKENISVLGELKSCYYVKRTPLNGSTGVYDERWYDEQGMIVKEKHVVGKDGYRVTELIKMVNK